MLKPDQVNKLKYAAKGLKGIKAISNALGTSPTATPDVDTKITKKYNPGDGNGDSKDNSGDRKYEVDAEGKGYFVDEKARPTRKQTKRKIAY